MHGCKRGWPSRTMLPCTRWPAIGSRQVGLSAPGCHQHAHSCSHTSRNSHPSPPPPVHARERFPRLCRCQAVVLVLAPCSSHTSQGQLLSRVLQMHQLPPVAIASGQGTVAGKLSSLLHSLKLECGPSAHKLPEVLQRIVCFTTDLGAESGLADAAGGCLQYLPAYHRKRLERDIQEGVAPEHHGLDTEYVFDRALECRLVSLFLHVPRGPKSRALESWQNQFRVFLCGLQNLGTNGCPQTSWRCVLVRFFARVAEWIAHQNS